MDLDDDKIGASDVQKQGRPVTMGKRLCQKLPVAILLVMIILPFSFRFLRAPSDLWSSYPFPKSHETLYSPTSEANSSDIDSSLNNSQKVDGSGDSKPASAPSVVANLSNASLTTTASKFWCGHRPCASQVSCGITVNASYPFQGPSLRWSPRPSRYLMMVCGYGQFCNRMDCILHHLVIAAVLQRTLVFPLAGQQYDFENLLDIPRISQCLGNDTVVSLAEFRALRNGSRRHDIDLLRMLANEHPWPIAGVTTFRNYTKIKIRNFTNATAFKDGESSADFFRQFDVEDEVLSVGEAFGTNVGPEACLVLRGFQPFETSCGQEPVLQPHPNILNAAWGFARAFLGSNFTSLHLRRGDFFRYCTWKGDQCYYSIPQVADCLRRHQREINGCEGSNIIFVATNGRRAELEQLQALLLTNDDHCPLTVVTLSGVLGEFGPEGIPLQEWNSPLTDEQRKNGDVLAALDRAISALGRVFLGDNFSTYTAEIQRLRVGWRINHDRDGFLCGAVKPDWRGRPWRKAAKR